MMPGLLYETLAPFHTATQQSRCGQVHPRQLSCKMPIGSNITPSNRHATTRLDSVILCSRA
jgi:hypothetical protein